MTGEVVDKSIVAFKKLAKDVQKYLDRPHRWIEQDRSGKASSFEYRVNNQLRIVERFDIATGRRVDGWVSIKAIENKYYGWMPSGAVVAVRQWRNRS